ncbi:HigA family addiction module antitoxin [Larkinella sp.]|uniref:HigA family addiction module antitoxin n=1 Tax=Larkinella sp. TaxID=2034517 RepID=UPI003BABD794
MSTMFNPSHPGAILKDLYLAGVGLTVTEAAASLGISRKTLSQIINGHAGISPQMALTLAQAFPTSTPEQWLDLQQQYDLWQARQKKQQVIAPLWPAKSRIPAAQ